MNIRSIIFALACAAIAVSAASAQAPRQSNKYDGLWSVSVVTEKGECDRGYRYPLRITRGKITRGSVEDNLFEINGRVDDTGKVSVVISAGGKSAGGTGRMTSRTEGSGTWHVIKGTSCSGYWEAERRGN